MKVVVNVLSKARRSHISGSSAFSLIEIMVVVTLLSIIILGLMAMFTQTQRAFRLGMAQTDVLESGRLATDIIARELSQITPNYLGAPNFYTSQASVDDQMLPGTPALLRTNVLQDLFFATRENQTWTGVGYFVRSNPTNNVVGPVASLYRFQMTNSAARFQQKPNAMFQTFGSAAYPPVGVPNLLNVSKILDGVVSFRIRAYNTNGVWISPLVGSAIPTGYPNSTNIYSPIRLTPPSSALASSEVGYEFYSNAVPAFLEFEIGILEPKILEKYQSIPIAVEQEKYLQKQASHVHLFRQRVSVRNVDWAAYQ